MTEYHGPLRRPYKDVLHDQLAVFGDNLTLRQRFIAKEQRRLGLEERMTSAQLKSLRAYIDALDWVCETLRTVKPGYDVSGTPSIPRMRAGVHAAVSAWRAAQQEPTRDVTHDWTHAFWFDLRGLPYEQDDSMTDMGEDLVDRGVVRLPFDNVVFVVSLVNNDTHASLCQRISWQDGQMKLHDVIVYGRGRPTLYYPESVFTREHYYFLAVMNTKYAERVTQTLERHARANRPTNSDIHYYVVRLNGRYASVRSDGTHATPRLHWRRGHTRRLTGDRVTTVSPHLVGSQSRGIIVHDYVSG